MIKYRVWDNTEQKYDYDGYSIGCDGKLYKSGGVVELAKDYIIEQYTGLKDKNGVEIYEGDIVKHRGYYGRAKNSAVEFNKGCFNTGEHDGSSTRKRPMLLQNNCEVMGNVHEDGELLEEKQ